MALQSLYGLIPLIRGIGPSAKVCIHMHACHMNRHVHKCCCNICAYIQYLSTHALNSASIGSHTTYSWHWPLCKGIYSCACMSYEHRHAHKCCCNICAHMQCLYDLSTQLILMNVHSIHALNSVSIGSHIIYSCRWPSLHRYVFTCEHTHAHHAVSYTRTHFSLYRGSYHFFFSGHWPLCKGIWQPYACTNIVFIHNATYHVNTCTMCAQAVLYGLSTQHTHEFPLTHSVIIAS